jgi:hypothetical protein
MDFAKDFGMLCELPLCHSYPEKLVRRYHRSHHCHGRDILAVDRKASILEAVGSPILLMDIWLQQSV